MEWFTKQIEICLKLETFKLLIKQWNGQSQNVNVVPGEVLTSFNNKFCIGFNFIRVRLVNFYV